MLSFLFGVVSGELFSVSLFLNVDSVSSPKF